MSHCDCFDQLKIPTISAENEIVAPLSLQLSGENFTLDWFHYFQLLSIDKISIFCINNRSFADRCNTMTKTCIFLCIYDKQVEILSNDKP